MQKSQEIPGIMTPKTHPRILIVDDQAINIHQISQVLPANYEVFMATSAEQALEICAKTPPDLILLDIMMPTMNGLEFCRILKKQPEMQDIPVIFVTALQSTEEENACWAAGAVDFVTKPVNFMTLLNRVNAHLTLYFQKAYLRELALVDGLTGIANRRAFDERIKIDFHRAQRTKTSLGVILIDVDFFKSYNDQYGHPAGDECLCQIAALLQSTFKRSTDLVARYGGEEFICLITDTEEKSLLLIAEKICHAVQHLKIKHTQSKVAPMVTISLGLAIYPNTPCKCYQDLIEVADKRLYKAKLNGRNQVCFD